MTRRATILAALAAVLMVALTWVLLYQPSNETIAGLQLEIAGAEARSAELTTRVEQLRVLREAAPEAEAQLARGASIIPGEPSLPALLRQVQLAADDAGVTLRSVAPGRPEPVTVEAGSNGLARLSLVVDVEAQYFQIVDFLRRLEDPEISPRGLLWTAAIVGSEYEDYPALTVSLQGDLFAIVPVITPEGDDLGVEGEAPSEGTEEAAEAVDEDAPVETEEAES